MPPSSACRDHTEYLGHSHTGGVPGRHELDSTQELNWAAICTAIVETGFEGYLAHEFSPIPGVVEDATDIILNLKQVPFKMIGEGSRTVRLKAHQLVAIPNGIGFEAAAALPCAYGTARRMMFTNGRVASGEKVLILGASGPVISAARSNEAIDRSA